MKHFNKGVTVRCTNDTLFCRPDDVMSAKDYDGGQHPHLVYGHIYMVVGLQLDDTINVVDVETGKKVTGAYVGRFTLATNDFDSFFN